MAVFVSAVDKSARLYISRIIPFMTRKNKDEIFTTSRELSHIPGVRCIAGLDKLSVVGIPNIRYVFPELIKILKFFAAEGEKIKRAIFVDSPDLNIPLGAMLKSMKGEKIKNFYFIPPTVWAWREERKKLVDKFFDKVLYILPFERKIWEDGIYVGHPLCKIVKEEMEAGIISANSKGQREKKKKRELKIAFLPGSRYSELVNHFGLILSLPKKIKGDFFTPTDFPEFFRYGGIKVFPSYLSRWVMSNSDVVVASSGSSNLESALLGKPLVVFYKLPKHVFEIAKKMVNVKFISMPNLVLGRRVFPELIQDQATPERIYEEVEKLKESDFSDIKQKLFDILDRMEFHEIAEIFMDL